MRSAVLVFLAAAVAFSGCAHGSASTAANSDSSAGPPPRPVRISILPRHGRTNVRPDRGITVRARRGTLTEVAVRAGGEPVEGTFNANRTVWRTRWALGVSRAYKITATATNSTGEASTRHRAFRTLTPQRTFAPRTIL